MIKQHFLFNIITDLNKSFVLYRQVGFAIVLILCLYSIRVYTRIDWRSLIAATVWQYICGIYKITFSAYFVLLLAGGQ